MGTRGLIGPLEIGGAVLTFLNGVAVCWGFTVKGGNLKIICGNTLKGGNLNIIILVVIF